LEELAAVAAHLLEMELAAATAATKSLLENIL
jgi:hypothetical protein